MTITLRILATLLPLVGGLAVLAGRRRWYGPLGFGLSLLLFLVSYTDATLVAGVQWLPGLQAGVAVDAVNSLLHPLVAVVALMVAIFSVYYMEGSAWPGRYWAFLGAFTTAMHGLLLSPNLLQVFFFWELVGLCSFLLISYYQSQKAALAARKAFWLNRLGDAGLLAGILGLWTGTGSLSWEAVAQAPAWVPYALFLGVMAKSAQFPLQVWLPDAMAGPTTASALIHAATMVAAGVYLLARLVPYMGAGPLTFLLVLGTFTATMAALCALAQKDIKRLLAYSTISQLGFMVAAMGTGHWQAGLLHLTTHAFFKAGLFLGAGVVIHELSHHLGKDRDPQNLYEMGGLARKLPITTLAMTVCGLALAGLPLTSGALSKEAVLDVVLARSPLAGSVLLFASVLTAAYVTKLLWLAFYRPNPASSAVAEQGWVVRLPLLLLAALALWLMYSPHPLDATSGWWGRIYHLHLPHTQMLPLLAACAWLLGGAMAYVFFRTKLWQRLEDVPCNKLEMLPFDALAKDLAATGKMLARRGSGQLQARHVWGRWMQGFSGLLAHHFYLDRPWEWAARALLRLSQLLGWVDARVVDGLVNFAARTVGGGSLSYMASISTRVPVLWLHRPLHALHLAGAAAHMDYSVVDGAVRATGNAWLWLGRRLRGVQEGRTQVYVKLSLASVLVLILLLLL